MRITMSKNRGLAVMLLAVGLSLSATLALAIVIDVETNLFKVHLSTVGAKLTLLGLTDLTQTQNVDCFTYGDALYDGSNVAVQVKYTDANGNQQTQTAKVTLGSTGAYLNWRSFFTYTTKDGLVTKSCTIQVKTSEALCNGASTWLIEFQGACQ